MARTNLPKHLVRSPFNQVEVPACRWIAMSVTHNRNDQTRCAKFQPPARLRAEMVWLDMPTHWATAS